MNKVKKRIKGWVILNFGQFGELMGNNVRKDGITDWNSIAVRICVNHNYFSLYTNISHCKFLFCVELAEDWDMDSAGIDPSFNFNAS